MRAGPIAANYPPCGGLRRTVMAACHRNAADLPPLNFRTSANGANAQAGQEMKKPGSWPGFAVH